MLGPRDSGYTLFSKKIFKGSYPDCHKKQRDRSLSQSVSQSVSFSTFSVIPSICYNPILYFNKKTVMSQGNRLLPRVIFVGHFLTAHAENRHISTSGIKSDFAIVYFSLQPLRFPIKKCLMVSLSGT